MHGFHQLISQPTHLLLQSPPCIDLIFTDQLNLIVHPSLHSNCHHQITHCKLNLNIKYPPPYERLVRDYNKVNVESIPNLLAPNKLVTFDDRDLSWMNDFVKSEIKWKNQLYNTYAKNGCKFNDHLHLQEATNLVAEVITKRKQDDYNNPATSAKTYWSILKTFDNGKEIPVIPPLLINNKLVSNIKEKANHFNCFFVSHCTPLDNNSKISETQTFITDNKLSSVQFEDNDIIKIIRSLNICKAHRHDDISIRMLKLCDLAIVKPLSIIFSNCVKQSTFPDIWKKLNICPIHKNSDKQLINNYKPASLLPICGKIFERLIFNSLFEYLEKHNLLSSHQSGFRANDSCVNQLLSIVHDIYTAFGAYPTLESRGAFLDMSKAFDKIWHEGLIFKLKSVGISDTLSELIKLFLKNRFQRIVLNGQTSKWLPVKADVPEGSILGPLFFPKLH